MDNRKALQGLLIDNDQPQTSIPKLSIKERIKAFPKKFVNSLPKICLNIVAFVIVVGRMVYLYIGLAFYFYIIVQFLLSYFSRLFTDLFLSKWYFFFSNLCATFISMPIVHFVLHQLCSFFFNFFQHLFDFFDIKGEGQRILRIFDSEFKKHIKMLYGIECITFFYLFIFAAFILITKIMSIFDYEFSYSFILDTQWMLFFCITDCMYPPIFELIIFCFTIMFPIQNSDVIEFLTEYNTDINGNQEQTNSNPYNNLHDLSSSNTSENENNTDINANQDQSNMHHDDNLHDSSASNSKINQYSHTMPLDPIFGTFFWEYVQYSDEIGFYIRSLKTDANTTQQSSEVDSNQDRTNHSNIDSQKYVKIFIASIIYIILFICSIVLEILGYKELGPIDITTCIISNVISLLLCFFTFKGIIMILTNFKSLEKYTFVRWCWYAIFALYSLLIIVLFVLFGRFYLTTKLSKLNYTYSPIERKINIDNPAAYCSLNYYDLNLIQYAGLAALGHSTNKVNANEIVKLLFSDSSLFPNISIQLNETEIGHFFQVRLNESFSIISFNSLIDLQDYAFLIENILPDVIAKKIMSIIPMFETLFQNVFIEIANRISELITIQSNFNLASFYFTEFLFNTHEYITEQNITAVYTGFSAGGMLAKTVRIAYDLPVVAFNSLQTYYSTFSHTYKNVLNKKNLSRTNSKLPTVNLFNYFMHRKTSHLINVLMPSMILLPDLGPTINIQLPTVSIKNSLEMMCLTAAGCDLSGKYDDFCTQVMGYKKYMQLFEIWNRSRSN